MKKCEIFGMVGRWRKLFGKLEFCEQIVVQYKRVGGGVIDVPKHPKNCVGADIIRPLIYINNNLSSFLFYRHAEADIARQWEWAAVEYFKIAEIFCVQLAGGHIFIYKIAGV